LHKLIFMNIIERLLLAGLGYAVGSALGRNDGITEEEKQQNARSKGLLGAGIAFGGSFLIEGPDDTVNYTLKHKGRLVYHGITKENRLDKRLNEHERSGKKFDVVWYDDPKPRATALDSEKRYIQRYGPKYNVHHNS
jgi:hypothetical protein